MMFFKRKKIYYVAYSFVRGDERGVGSGTIWVLGKLTGIRLIELKEKIEKEVYDIVSINPEDAADLQAENEKLKEKLDIAVKVLEFYADKDYWSDCRQIFTEGILEEAMFVSGGFKSAQEALAKIKGE